MNQLEDWTRSLAELPGMVRFALILGVVVSLIAIAFLIAIAIQLDRMLNMIREATPKSNQLTTCVAPGTVHDGPNNLYASNGRCTAVHSRRPVDGSRCGSPAPLCFGERTKGPRPSQRWRQRPARQQLHPRQRRTVMTTTTSAWAVRPQLPLAHLEHPASQGTTRVWPPRSVADTDLRVHLHLKTAHGGAREAG